MKIWRLRSGEDRRFNAGHPWVYSNELLDSPGGITPGTPVELQSPAGDFLARGYGNPASLIAFRSLSRDPEELEPTSFEGILKRIQNAALFRKSLGLSRSSYRLCFGEADFLPGLIIDRYFLRTNAQVFVIQSHTAGADQLLPLLPDVLKTLVESQNQSASWENTGIVLRNDLGIRKLEGLKEEEPKLLKELPGVNFLDTEILVPSSFGENPIPFRLNLFTGQKTGFFLDQVSNIQLVTKLLGSASPVNKTTANHPDEIKILDLCSYVGHWGTQLAGFLKHKNNKNVSVHAVDASADALRFAQHNIESQSAQCSTLKGDVLKDLNSLASQSYDIVICDPPALIKGRKHIPQGRHAYLQLNTQALRLVKEGGTFVSCSCSSLLEEEEFLKVLSKASLRNKRTVRWMGRGCQAPDHPVLAEFPEGRYLKMWVGQVWR